MPTITIVTHEQRAAVAAAAQAASIVRARIADAALIELARDDSPIDGDTKYDLLNVWGAGECDGHDGVENEWLWSAAADHDGHHRLPADEVRQVQLLLQTAGDTEPFLFEPGELASNSCQLDIDAVLAANQS